MGLFDRLFGRRHREQYPPAQYGGYQGGHYGGYQPRP